MGTHSATDDYLHIPSGAKIANLTEAEINEYRKSFSGQIILARGERTLKEYAYDSGVHSVTISRLIKKEFNPSLATIYRLTSESAAPRNGITTESMIESAESEGLIMLTKPNPFVPQNEQLTPIMALAHLSLQLRLTAEGHNAYAIGPSLLKDFDNNTYHLNYFHYSPIADQRHNELVQLLGSLALEPRRAKHFEYIVVDNAAYFDELASKAKKINYRGNLLLILVAPWAKGITSETILCKN